MADLTTNTVHKTRHTGAPRQNAYPVADGITIGFGALVQLESGYLNHWDGTGQFRGLLKNGAASVRTGLLTGDTDALVPPTGTVDESGVTLMHVAVGGTPSQANVGALVYSADSDPASLTITDPAAPPVGTLVGFRSTSDCDVRLFNPEEFAAGVADATWNS